MNKSIIEVKHELLNYFTNDDAILPELNFESVKFTCEDRDLKIALIIEGLKELEKDEVVRRVSYPKIGCECTQWVLVKPLSMYQRTIYCGYDTVAAVANSINEFLKQGGNTRDLVDASTLNETNIQTLVLIANSLMAKK